MVAFRVPGIARPQGSKSAFPYRRHDGAIGVRLVEKSRHLMAWRDAIRDAATSVDLHAWDLGWPICVEMTVHKKRPQSHYRKGTLRDDAPAWPTRPPDLDKIQRAVGDALTGVLWTDDSQIICWVAWKRWAEHDDYTEIRVRRTIATTTAFVHTGVAIRDVL